MLFERIESRGLSAFSYFLEDQGEAVVIDPRRDIDVYLRLADARQARIRYILETHRQEDLVSGAAALAMVCGGQVVHAGTSAFAHGTPAREGDVLEIGDLEIRVLETPGHTEESLTFLVADRSRSPDPIWAFTGDALFAGDVGRTDLYGPAESRRMARELYASLTEKILAQGDHVIVCPAHGGGSVCGGNIDARPWTTIGYERRNSPILRESLGDPQEFVARKVEERHVRPPYFTRMRELNMRGDVTFGGRAPDLIPLGTADFARHGAAGAVVVDLRMPQAFAGGHVPGSYNIWANGLTAYLPWTVHIDTPVVLVLPEEADRGEIARQLFRIGYDRVEGYLSGGFERWQNENREIERLDTIQTAELSFRLENGEDILVLDVRKPGEWENGSVPGALPLFVGELQHTIEQLPRNKPIVTMCSVGHRGGLAASMLLRNGFERVSNYLGGFRAWQAGDNPVAPPRR